MKFVDFWSSSEQFDLCFFCAVRLCFEGEDDSKTLRSFSFPSYLIFSDVK